MTDLAGDDDTERRSTGGVSDRGPVASTDGPPDEGAPAAPGGPPLLDVLAVFAVAYALRLAPLAESPLPFNPDGIVAAARARDALATGALGLSGLPTDSVGFTAALSVASALVGGRPLYIGQPVSAAVGALTVVVGSVLAWRLATGAGLSRRRSRFGGLVAGALLSVDGVYLYRSMPTDEQTIGLLLVPLTALALARALPESGGGSESASPDGLAPESGAGHDSRGGPRSGPAGRSRRVAWALLATGLYAVLPPVHNLDGLVAALAATVVLAVWAVREPTRRRVLGAGLAGSLAWTLALGYHPLAAAVTPTRVVQSGRLTDAAGLFVAWAVFVVLAAVWFAGRPARTQRLTLAVVFASWFGAFAVNAAVTVYPGTVPTPAPLLVALLPLLVPALIAGWAVPFATRARSSVGAGITRARTGLAVFGLLVAPVVFVGFALTATLSPRYLTLLYRAQLFVHVPVGALAGVGTVVLAGRLAGDVNSGAANGGAGDAPAGWRRGVAGVAVAGVVLCGAAGAPVVLAGYPTVPFEGVTTPAELDATGVAARHADGWATDDHLARVGSYHRRAVAGPSGRPTWATGAAVGPLLGWVADGGPPPPCPVVAERSWTTDGAQAYPHPPVVLDSDAFDRWTATNSVAYRADAPGDLFVVVPRPGAGSKLAGADAGVGNRTRNEDDLNGTVTPCR